MAIATDMVRWLCYESGWVYYLLATLVVARFSGQSPAQSPDNLGSITVGPKNHTLKISHVFFQKMPIFCAFPAYFLGISVENLPSHILRSLVPNYIWDPACLASIPDIWDLRCSRSAMSEISYASYIWDLRCSWSDTSGTADVCDNPDIGSALYTR